MSELTSQSLVKLCKSIKEKKVSSTEVTKAVIERSEKSKTLNAYITTQTVGRSLLPTLQRLK